MTNSCCICIYTHCVRRTNILSCLTHSHMDAWDQCDSAGDKYMSTAVNDEQESDEYEREQKLCTIKRRLGW